MLIEKDFLFYCDANELTGFGHASRCAKIAKLITKLDYKTDIGICGKIQKNARNFIMKTYPNINFYSDKRRIFSKVSIIDKMFNIEDPDYFDYSFIESVKKKSERTVILLSGIKIPAIDKDIIYIGYQPSKENFKEKNIFWGFDYVPTINQDNLKNKKRTEGTLFLALGGHKNTNELFSVIEAINLVNEITQLNILFSPVNKAVNIDKLKLRKELKVKTFQNVSNINSFLMESSVVISSYGNLCFETLSRKTPLIIVAQKKFQKKIGDILEKKKIALSLGFPSKTNLNKLKCRIENFYLNRKIYTKDNKISNNGLKNITNILIKVLKNKI